MEKTEKYRMYFLTPYSLSNIQKGIQCGHAALEYAYKYSDDDDFQRFVKYDKTWIVLNGGVSNHQYHDFNSDKPLSNTNWTKVSFDDNNLKTIGTMEQHWNFLQENKIKATYFLEPDANNMMTSICFLVPNEVFNGKSFPDWIKTNETINEVDKIKLREIYFSVDSHDDLKETYDKHFITWSNTLGGLKYGLLKVFLSRFKLA